MKALKTDFDGNPNVGLYGFATDKYCLVGKGIRKEVLANMKEVLKVPVHTITINNSHLVGVYCCGNENLLLVPEIIKENEEKELRVFKIPYKIVKSNFSALGNNIVVRGDKCIINPEFEKNIDKGLKEFNIYRMCLGEHNTVGSCIVVNKKGCLVNIDIQEKEIEKIEKALNVHAGIGSVNRGNPYVRSGIICNSNGYIIGGETTGVEIMRIETSLGFSGK